MEIEEIIDKILDNIEDNFIIKMPTYYEFDGTQSEYFVEHYDVDEVKDYKIEIKNYINENLMEQVTIQKIINDEVDKFVDGRCI